MHDAVVAGREFRLRDHILHHRAVLDLRNADHHGIILILGGDVEQHPFEVPDFPGVLGRVPLLGSFGRELLIEDAGIVNGVEQVLEVVEDHFVGLLREACHRDQRGKQSCQKDSLHKRFLLLRFNSLYHNPYQSARFFWLFTASATAGSRFRKNLKPVSSSISFTERTADSIDVAAPASSLVNTKPMAFSSSALN